jgi:BED zinc finger
MFRNPIWNYFTKLESDASKAQCNDCTKALSLGSDKPGKQTVRGLKCHLETYHKELFATYVTHQVWGWSFVLGHKGSFIFVFFYFSA